MADHLRLARLARVREVERRRAAEEAARTGGDHARLHALAGRSGDLAALYGARTDPHDGTALAALFRFRQELASLNVRATGDAETARLVAEHARQGLAAAQRRRDLVDERVRSEKQAASQRAMASPDLAQTLNRSGKAELQTSPTTAGNDI